MVYSDSIDGGQEGSGDQCGCVHWTKTASCVACSLIWGQRVANSVQCLTTRGVLPLHSCGKMQNVFKIHIRNVLGWKWVRQNGLNIPVPEASDFFLPKEKFPCSARFKKGELMRITYSHLGLFSSPNLGCSKLYPTILVSWGCHSNLPPTLWLKTTETYPLTVLEARNPKWRCWQSHAPSERSTGKSFFAPSRF